MTVILDILFSSSAMSSGTDDLIECDLNTDEKIPRINAEKLCVGVGLEV
jgi:hypothetical protein